MNHRLGEPECCCPPSLKVSASLDRGLSKGPGEGAVQPGEQANQQSPSGLTGLGGKVEGPGSASSVRKEGQRPEQSSACPPSKPWPSPELWDRRRATRQTSSTWQGGLCGVLRDQAGRANLTLQRSTQATCSGAGGQLPARRAATLWSVQSPAPSLSAGQRQGGTLSGGKCR